MRVFGLLSVSVAALILAGVAHANTNVQPGSATAANAAANANVVANPFTAAWTTPFQAPPFDKIQAAHFRPAFDSALAAHKAEIEAIANRTDRATFDNTILAMERAGADLGRVQRVFFNMTSANTSDDIQAIQRDMAPILARHGNEISLNPKLFARVKAVHDRRARLNPEQRRLVERMYVGFVRAGAALEGADRERFAAINERLSTLSTAFSQNQLADTRAWTLTLMRPEDFAGLPEATAAAARSEAQRRGLPAGQGLITLQRPSVEPFLTFSTRRDLREKAFIAWAERGNNNNANDNKDEVAEIVALRAERAALLGYPSHAHFMLAERMAETPQRARDLLDRVWAPARQQVLSERDALEKMMNAEGVAGDLKAWDYRHYAEKLRQKNFAIDESEISQYLTLDNMIDAQFYIANRLFGLTFTERTDIPVYEPSVRVWEVKDAKGKHVGLFYGDFYGRANKQSGAWMSSYRIQDNIDGFTTPQVVNVLNYNKPAPGKATLLSYDDAETLFHEFGHALHGLMSRVTYPTLAGTATPTDFVEFPAQIYEHYLAEPEILSKFAKHHESGAPMPAALIERLQKARRFGQGFATVEFVASAYVDLDFHALAKDQAKNIDVAAFEKASLEKIGMPEEIIMRHRTTHFGHIFSGGYSAGYYAYLWSEILDADGFDALKETGDIFNPTVAQRLKTYVYSAGNLRPAALAYRSFRGRDPDVAPLMRNRGLN
jgi:peptidyl-dipeptidase Dcp